MVTPSNSKFDLQLQTQARRTGTRAGEDACRVRFHSLPALKFYNSDGIYKKSLPYLSAGLLLHPIFAVSCAPANLAKARLPLSAYSGIFGATPCQNYCPTRFYRAVLGRVCYGGDARFMRSLSCVDEKMRRGVAQIYSPLLQKCAKALA